MLRKLSSSSQSTSYVNRPPRLIRP
jgi:hypothetical protein